MKLILKFLDRNTTTRPTGEEYEPEPSFIIKSIEGEFNYMQGEKTLYRINNGDITDKTPLVRFGPTSAPQFGSTGTTLVTLYNGTPTSTLIKELGLPAINELEGDDLTYARVNTVEIHR